MCFFIPPLIYFDSTSELYKLFYFQPFDPVQSLIGVHGRNGVTSICSNSGYIYTTGRDGYIRQYKLSEENLQLLDKKKVWKWRFVYKKFSIWAWHFGGRLLMLSLFVLFRFFILSLSSRRKLILGLQGNGMDWSGWILTWWRNLSLWISHGKRLMTNFLLVKIVQKVLSGLISVNVITISKLTQNYFERSQIK